MEGNSRDGLIATTLPEGTTIASAGRGAGTQSTMSTTVRPSLWIGAE
eukprot:CAMPEP_0184711080 /NCGR_PEP_ID=MMETSP0314-20130426/1790_1 /TAXON_ID=38298 /ORGANISM="Rhodella maculata, Strain CCMP 736" /LENGTH=46 /DNA_ID= /DNA_START= /DNA_END= /DNA_ORIENTATION=